MTPSLDDDIAAQLEQFRVRGDRYFRQLPDIDLMTLAVEHGLRLATSDSGLVRFVCSEWCNPLRPA